METIKEKIPGWLQEEVDAYIKNPETQVFINYNNDSGVWQYSVEVYENQLAGLGFWLDSFKTNKEAEKYIKDNNLKLYKKEERIDD